MIGVNSQPYESPQIPLGLSSLSNRILTVHIMFSTADPTWNSIFTVECDVNAGMPIIREPRGTLPRGHGVEISRQLSPLTFGIACARKVH